MKYQATLDLSSLQDEPSQAVRVAVYRVAQEGLANLIRHSGATAVRLHVGQSGDRLEMTLEDNGQGFEVEALLAGRVGDGLRGIGLRAMREEALALNGAFSVQSGPGGTRLELLLPLRED